MKIQEPTDLSIVFRQVEVLKSITTKKGSVTIYKHNKLKKILVINGEVQHVEEWAPLYHEPLVHLPISFMEEVKSVLILGGGSFYTAVEVMKYNSLNKVIMVDYDKGLIDLIDEIYPHTKSVLEDNRFQLVIEDLYSYVDSTNERFDLIINDAIDLTGGTDNFDFVMYDKLSNICTNRGCCVDLIYRNVHNKNLISSTVSYLNKIYSLRLSLLFVPEYPGILHLLTIWSKSNKVTRNHSKSINQEQINRTNDESFFTYYNPASLAHYCYLPPYLKRIMTT